MLRIPGVRLAVLSLSIPLLVAAVSCATNRSPRRGEVAGAMSFSILMLDGKQWTSKNLDLETADSYCYAQVALNCRQYGRLYSWRSAQLACRSLGAGWRLPTNDDWHHLANQYGGLRDASLEAGRPAYLVLSVGGSSGFNALLGGGRSPDGSEYARLDAHGFYWTATETGPSTAWFYNFGKGQLALGRHDDGEKERAFSVRCVRD